MSIGSWTFVRDALQWIICVFFVLLVRKGYHASLDSLCPLTGPGIEDDQGHLCDRTTRLTVVIRLILPEALLALCVDVFTRKASHWSTIFWHTDQGHHTASDIEAAARRHHWFLFHLASQVIVGGVAAILVIATSLSDHLTTESRVAAWCISYLFAVSLVTTLMRFGSVLLSSGDKDFDRVKRTAALGYSGASLSTLFLWANVCLTFFFQHLLSQRLPVLNFTRSPLASIDRRSSLVVVLAGLIPILHHLLITRVVAAIMIQTARKTQCLASTFSLLVLTKQANIITARVNLFLVPDVFFVAQSFALETLVEATLDAISLRVVMSSSSPFSHSSYRCQRQPCQPSAWAWEKQTSCTLSDRLLVLSVSLCSTLQTQLYTAFAWLIAVAFSRDVFLIEDAVLYLAVALIIGGLVYKVAYGLLSSPCPWRRRSSALASERVITEQTLAAVASARQVTSGASTEGVDKTNTNIFSMSIMAAFCTSCCYLSQELLLSSSV